VVTASARLRHPQACGWRRHNDRSLHRPNRQVKQQIEAISSTARLNQIAGEDMGLRQGSGNSGPPKDGANLVLPIVLYNGEERWWAARELADLIEEVDPEADRFRPRLRYRLIDEGSYPLADLQAQRNLAAVLFWLEKTPDPADLRRAIARLVESLGSPEDGELRSAFAAWLKTVRIPGQGMQNEEIPETLGLEDFQGMLEKRVEEWNQILLEQGRQEGRQEGEASLVLRLLERKFGPLDAASRRRVKKAEPERLLAWADRILEARHLRDVFGD
jgi:hypothetical protein